MLAIFLLPVAVFCCQIIALDGAVSRLEHGRAPAATEREARTRTILETIAPNLNFDALPIDQALDWLHASSTLNITTRWQDLIDCGISREQPITLRARSVSLRSVIELLCEELSTPDCRIDYDLHDTGVVICPVDEIIEGHGAMPVRVYPVRDILEFAAQQGADGERIMPDLAKLAQRLVTPWYWKVGGAADAHVIRGVLVARATARSHESLEEFLAAIRVGMNAIATRHGGRKADVIVFNDSTDSDGIEFFPPPSVAELRTHELLRQRLPEISFEDGPLDGMLQWAEGYGDISIYVHWRELAEAGIAHDKPTTSWIKPMTMNAFLDRIANEAGYGEIRVGFELRPSGVHFSTREALRGSLVTRVYPVDRILHAIAAEPNGRGAAALARLLVDVVEPDVWNCAGGPCVIEPLGPMLLVRASRDVHGAVVDMLRTLEVASSGRSGVALSDEGCVSFPRPKAAENRMRATLETILPEVSFDELTISNALEWFAGYCEVPIRADWAALESAGVPRDKPVTNKLKHLTLRQSLAVCAEEAGGSDVPLGFEIRENEIVFSTIQELRESLVTRVYPVQRVVEALADSSPDGGAAIDELAKVICRLIEPDVWRDSDGYGIARPLGSVLVVRSSRDVHERICPFLDDLKAMAAEK